jgi:hypothetical protein
MLPVSDLFLYFSKYVRFLVVPEHGFSKHQTHGHVVYQRFQSAASAVGLKKMCMAPHPEITMFVAAVVSLKPPAKRIPFHRSAIDRNASGEDCIGMGRSRKPDPSFITERDVKAGSILQFPGYVVATAVECASATVLGDFVLATAKVERRGFPRTEIKIRQ